MLLNINLPGIKLFKKGKVRNVFDLGDKLLLVASDRISAFDSVMPNGIPDKGKVLTQLSAFWFDFTKQIIDNHMISANVDEFPDEIRMHADIKKILAKRSMLGRKTASIDVECVARGYLSGSAWSEYEKTGSVCGIKLPAGLKESDKLPEPIFTPATKAASGHDVNISEKEMMDIIGVEPGTLLRDKTLEIYNKCRDYADSKGIIIADTKFEFGFVDGEIIIIDEMLTPDSSRFWPKDSYRPGGPQPSYDKQFVRDYLISIKWDKEPPAPLLPDAVVQKTREKYLEAFQKITGKNVL
ncbi:phosphoribosylaminoimidazolesuccinocarboxamide synthase [candidate division WOR-1 bacterium RIFCSPLOWO2_02_FULL_46_20]|uniref:Phosphoribosylaminoimidazole-succinocarboxamide synthase n=2 Tax=Saganbacteria TaxID=1703751 RepID=A0A1F4RD63_UNCSA|nr:MAG: phosphoribosylaminoimidazolesuccinocarboxamide synthase [candidate division WOR-1 bacterium RIFCSPHIGHO2_02_FULL_45_12]OGC06119.1 MAG: phosphoribosylaminoimidazolesuccinocarboxamide synthase [candidate division WOR-1 bacterium RIFCSPLOWO2_02_FULL_46_20]OGC09392.1 MAG: phosphoribosylaminoimidazolesuccinocarboxamide synthase [candidate division WOR-1 bacterium RIFCSPLOWO2_12_FULL_45_9]